MSLLSISAASTDYIEVEVTSSEDPTAQAVWWAFPQTHTDVDTATWTPGTWRTDSSGIYWAQCLLGPTGDETLVRGRYLMYVKWQSGRLVPAECAGTLEVF